MAGRTLELDLAEGNARAFKLTVSDPADAPLSAKRAHQGQTQRGTFSRQNAAGATLQQQQQAAWNQQQHRQGYNSGGRDVQGNSRHQQYPGAFSKGGEGGQGVGSGAGPGAGDVPPTEAVGDGGARADGVYGTEKRRSNGRPDLLPREIYEKLSEHVIGQVRVGFSSRGVGGEERTRGSRIRCHICGLI